MDKKTRVLNCMQNKPIDKIPCVYWHHYSGEESKGIACIKAHKKLYDETNIDFIKMMCDGYFGDTIPFQTKIVTPSDWTKIKIPEMNSSFVIDQCDRVKGMIEAVKDECCVHYVLFSAFTYLMQYYGLDFIVQSLRDEKSKPYVIQALKNMNGFIGELGSTLIKECGATGIHQAIGFNYLFSPEEYREFMRPNDEYLIETFKKAGGHNIVHLCGWDGIKNHEEVWKDYKMQVVHWDQHTDQLPIEEAKVIYENADAFMAGFDNKSSSIIYHGSKEQIQSIAKNYARAGGKTGFILSADCSLCETVPYERIRWITEAMDELTEEK